MNSEEEDDMSKPITAEETTIEKGVGAGPRLSNLPGRAPRKTTSCAATADTQPPKDRLEGLKENWKSDMVSGFILFLIALPLSLGIARASGAPPVAGLIAAVIGGMFVSQVSGSYVTINGPAAGLIVVILGSVERLGGGDAGYHYALAAIVISGIILAIAGMLKAGELGEFAPSSVVHGMLAAIGLIIIAKETPDLLGTKALAKEPLQLIFKIPEMIQHLNPEIALIGFASLALLIAHSMIKHPAVRKIPAPIVCVVLALVIGHAFNLGTAHDYVFNGETYHIDPAKALVVLPSNIATAITFPDFGKIATGAFWFSVLSITLVQGIETLLSCAAVDQLDIYKRKSALSKDVAAVGLGTTISGAIGGIPMIAEIVRSTANVIAGARTRWSNFFHGTFILLFVITCSQLINQIPVAALAALLIITGYRLAAPVVFKKTYEMGAEQLLLFCVTIVATLAVDLLTGVAAGIATKFALHIFRGAPLTSLFSARVKIEQDGDLYVAAISPVAIFSNYLSIKSQLKKVPPGKKLVIDLSQAKLVDHTVMDRFHHFVSDYKRGGGRAEVVGLERHTASARHPLASRRLTYDA
jgi:MFS superfamily sulfate permease-like transporter